MIKIDEVILCTLKIREWDKETKLRQVSMLVRLKQKANKILEAINEDRKSLIDVTAEAISQTEQEFNLKVIERQK
jgi:hypothetical protein